MYLLRYEYEYIVPIAILGLFVEHDKVEMYKSNHEL